LNKALYLYQAVLSSDPTSTAALTGQQLTMAKMRMQGVQTQAVAPQQPQPRVTNIVEAENQTPVTEVLAQSGEVDQLLAILNANPRDANAALKIAEYYKNAGNYNQAQSYYKKALQLDVVYGAGIDRMAIYDAMASMEQ